MAKNKTVFICTYCGYESSGYLGKCPACNQWSTFQEETKNSLSLGNHGATMTVAIPVKMNDII